MRSNDIATYNNIASSIGFGFSGPLVEVHSPFGLIPGSVCSARPRACMIQEGREEVTLGTLFSILEKTGATPTPCVCACVMWCDIGRW